MEDRYPSIDVLISDAFALGYSIHAMIIDEDNNARYVSNAKSNDGICFDDSKWIKALEKIHGGPISSVDQILEEEQRHREKEINGAELDELEDPDEIESWIQHYKLELFEIENETESNLDSEFKDESYRSYLKEIINQLEEKFESFQSHDTWFDPSKPNEITDSPCYCGWIGLDQPPPEFAPPNCSCVSNIEPNHGHDIGYIQFQEKKMEGDS
tara:strand:- start:3257 stop:3895 length:639 start_codon:yes stop_codon:yes gene_type:complete